MTQAELDAYVERLRRELPRFEVRFKDESALQRLIARLVWPFNRRYATDYTTVMFGRVYFPSRAFCEAQGTARVYCTLRHEAVHLRDARRYPLIFHLSYLLLLPFGLTTRALWEWRAYAESMRAELELYGQVSDELAQRIERAFTSSDYLFMWPFPAFIHRRVEALRARLTAEHVG